MAADLTLVGSATGRSQRNRVTDSGIGALESLLATSRVRQYSSTMWKLDMNLSRPAVLSGKLLNKIHIPSMNTTSACFGGPDLSTLLVTSAGVHNVPEDLHEEHGGRTFAVSDLGTKGRQPVEFSG